jgi:lysyl-tRNA synthetase class 1
VNEEPANVALWRDATIHARAWPFVEAGKLRKRMEAERPQKEYVLFETGYGPSGLPHIGTFGEVVRTSMVRHAFSLLSNMPTRLFAFSDDMDGLRRVPDNVPNQDLLERNLGKPLTAVPDPFGTYPSFGEHNNARLRAFLDQFGFEYKFCSATQLYKSGRFDAALQQILVHYDEIVEIVLPTLGAERRQTYSPFLPICARTGRVLQAPVVGRDVAAGTIVYLDDGRRVETPVTGGSCKLQWKVDWAMRWTALGVDYEMAGKDLIDSVRLSSRICKVIGGKPPEGFIYELFLDESGEKISKSKGNGLAVEDWLRYGPEHSLSMFMFQKPRSAKRLYFDVIPKTVDEYLEALARYPNMDIPARLDNPVWHIHFGHPPANPGRLSFSMLLNLISVCHSEDKDILWRYVSRYDPQTTPAASPLWDRLLDHAIAYYRDFVKPALRYRKPEDEERRALEDLLDVLRGMPKDGEPEAIQRAIYEVGKRHPVFPDLKAWFRCLYNVLLGQEDGPRMGSFVAFYGLDASIALIEKVIAGEDITGS